MVLGYIDITRSEWPTQAPHHCKPNHESKARTDQKRIVHALGNRLIINNDNCGLNQMSWHEKHIKNQNYVNFLAGLLGGFISVTLCNPLDIARTRLNVLTSPSHRDNQNKYTHFSHAIRTIWKQEGFKGFYAGYRTNVVALPIFHSLFFPLFEYTKKKCAQYGYGDVKSRFYATTLAGVVCNIITNPIWVIRTRLMVQYLHHQTNHYTRTAPFHVMKEMVEKEGVRSLFKGIIPSIFSVSNAIVYFQCYEQLKDWMKTNQPMSVFTIFLSSTISKIIASTLTYPIVVMRTVMYDYRGTQRSHFLDIVKHIINESGMKGFYAGLKPDLIRLIPSNAILFIVYQKSKAFL